MSGFWTFVFLCVLAGIGYDLIRRKHLLRHGHWEDQNGELQPLDRRDQARERELQTEVEQLRERVKVLERIVTDDRQASKLAHEIEQLRDKPVE